MIKALAVLVAAIVLASCAHGPQPAAPAVRHAEVGGARLAYVEQGSGETVVFVHGVAGDWRTWEPLRPYIAARHRFVAYSRRHHHPDEATGGAGAAYTVAQHVDDLIALVERFGAVHAVGGSAGGRIVAEAALKRPQLFKSITLSEPLMARPVDPHTLPAVLALGPEFGRVLAAAKEGDSREATVRLVQFVYGDADAWDRLPSDRQQRFLDNAGTFALMAAAPPAPPPPCERLGSYQMPVLVLEGEQTRAAFRATNDGLMHCLPKGSRRAVVPGAPHVWYPVNPKAGAQRILEFIESRR